MFQDLFQLVIIDKMFFFGWSLARLVPSEHPSPKCLGQSGCEAWWPGVTGVRIPELFAASCKIFTAGFEFYLRPLS